VQRYDATTALIVVDVQNDFADPRGSLAVDGGAHIVPFVNDQVRAAHEAGGVVIYSQDWHPEHTPHFATDGGIWPVHCVQDTWGAAFHEALTVEGPIVRKGTNGEDGYSAFTVREPLSGETTATELEQLLRDRTVRTVIVCGLATDYCVKATALDALRLRFATYVLADGVRSVDLQPGDGDLAIAELEEAGATIVHEWDDGRVHHEQEL
jgi:nicotinamidase/pyrazinamidase